MKEINVMEVAQTIQAMIKYADDITIDDINKDSIEITYRVGTTNDNEIFHFLDEYLMHIMETKTYRENQCCYRLINFNYRCSNCEVMVLVVK